MRLIKRLLILLTLLIAVPCWGADQIFVDSEWAGTEAGTFAQPYNTLAEGLAQIDEAGDAVYLRCGMNETTVYNGITQDGTALSYITIGAYYDSGNQNPGTAPTGTATIESDNPSFGETCGDGRDKPTLDNTKGTGYLIRSTADYVEFNSIKFQEAETGLQIYSNQYNIVRYCYFYDIAWGIYAALSSQATTNNIFEYNYFDLVEDGTDDNSDTVDCIVLYGNADSNTVQYNVFKGYDHFGVYLAGGDSNVVQYNYCDAGINGGEDGCFSLNSNGGGNHADSNIFRRNYSNSGGRLIQLFAATNNEIYGNVGICNGDEEPTNDAGCIHMYGTSDTYDITGNKIYNNVLYDNDNFTASHGFMIAASGGEISGNYIMNNVIQKVDGYCFKVYTSGTGDVSSNYYYNNDCYDFGLSYGSREGTGTYTLTQWNAQALAADNLESDPSLEDVTTGKFWPDSSSDPVVEAGYNVGSPYDYLLLASSDFTASPPEVYTQQFATDYIGAYGYGATYNYYFSSEAGGDLTTGGGSTCSEESPCATLSAAQTKITAGTDSDITNLHFDNTDTWTCATESLNTSASCLSVGASDGIVNILSYGSGQAIFDGQVADFSAVDNDDCSGSGSPCRYSSYFRFNGNDGSIANVEIKNVYGAAIFLSNGDGFDLSNSLIHDIGMEVLLTDPATGIEDSEITNNTMYGVENLYNEGKYSGWGGAIHFIASGSGASSMCQNNIIRYNLIYNSGGEGINAPNSIIEYNVVGDTKSVAIDTAPHDWDSTTSTVAYNLIVGSSSSTWGRGTALRIFDETEGGNNNASVTEFYGNIIINRNYGLRIFCNMDGNNDCSSDHTAAIFGTVRFYNNLIIDSITGGFVVDAGDQTLITDLYVYNNVFALYDRTDQPHSYPFTPGAGWDFDYNAFWTDGVPEACGGTDTLGDWDCDMNPHAVLTDPVLPGDGSVDWSPASAAGYYNTIEYTTHLYPLAGSSLVGAGKSDTGYEATFLPTGSDYSDVLSWPTGLVTAEQASSWDIGPWARGSASVYINLGVTDGSEDGTYAHPYDSVSDISGSISAANDYYFKCGSSETLASTWTISASGNSLEDPITFGAYYDTDTTATIETGTFGELCGNGADKPILKMTTQGTGTIINTNDGGSQYLEFDSVSFRTSETAIWLTSSYNVIEYSYLYDNEWGIRLGVYGTGNEDADYNTIQYNWIDANDATDEDGTLEGDGIGFRRYAQNNTVQYNYLTGMDHNAFSVNGGDSNIIQYNYISAASHCDHALAVGGDTDGSISDQNIFRYNFAVGSGNAQVQYSTGTEMYSNIIIYDGGTAQDSSGVLHLLSTSANANSVSTGGKFYNNVFAGSIGTTTEWGIALIGQTDATGDDIGTNTFANNIIYNIGDNCIREYDPNSAVADTNSFYNNACYLWDVDAANAAYAVYAGSTYNEATDLNDRDDSSGNIGTEDSDDSGMEAAGSNQFWPSSAASDLVENGYTLASPYDQLIVPGTTNFTASPPVVSLQTQSPNNIGAYRSSDAGPVAPTYPLQGAAGNFKYN